MSSKKQKKSSKIPYESHDIFICDCHSTEHQMVVHYSEDEYSDGTKHPMVYIHTHLNKRPFWQRLKYAIKYIFGYQCMYGAFDEFIINPTDSKKLSEIIDYLNEQRRSSDGVDTSSSKA
jgi:hypothetical protein